MALVDIAEQLDNRIPVSSAHLESEITHAVRASAAGCKGFVGVIIERLESRSHAAPNWAIKGVRFGRADRDKAGEVLPTVVERMQREFALAENEAAIPQMPTESAEPRDRYKTPQARKNDGESGWPKRR